MSIIVNKQKVKTSKNYDNFLLGKHETFCHVGSRGIDSSKRRSFDPNRANKIHWIKPILENSTDKRIKYFEGRNSEGQWCRFYWYKERNYIVILKEISCDLLLVTGYCVDLSETAKFNKQWQNYEAQEKMAKKTYLEGRYATLGNAIGSIFNSRHILYPLGIDTANIHLSFLKRK